MKKIRYLILGLVFACFGLSSFSSADYSFEYLTGGKLTSLKNNNGGTLLYTIPDDLTSFPLGEVYCFSGLVNSGGTTNSSLIRVGFFQGINYNSNNKPHTSLYFSTDNSTVLNLKNLFYCFTYYTYYTKNIVISSYNSTAYSDIDIDYSILRLSSNSGGGSNDCSTCETSLEALSGAYSTLSGYYSSCQSSLTSCQSGLSGYVDCQSSLTSCLEDNESLENMNISLNDQLQQCLVNGGDLCDPEVDTGCITGAFQVPLLSWSVGLDSFTTPIINNLVLPTNYKGKVVDGVLTISTVNNNLSISDEDIASIKDSLIEVLVSIFGLSLFLVLIYYIKFYMFNSK